MAQFKRKVQNFGKSLLFPISLMSFMAIFLGLSAALQNPNIIQIIPILENNIIQNILGFIRKLAGLPFGYLPILFALSIPLGMVKRDKAVAVYSAVVGYLALLIGMNYVLNLQGITAETSSMEYLIETLNMSEVDATLRNSLFTETLGIFVYNTNVIGGIIAGITTVFIHNEFRRTELPESLSFYSGKKFVPIMTAIILAIIGMGIT
ncbi:PTS transporter subunit EIIC, partial [Dolosigranulum pigrum]|uniref:PTS transporter subunit EIIC n=1 Tax=Dolosigranulum pigrum TaxID=29394 RepID=UPI0015EC89B0